MSGASDEASILVAAIACLTTHGVVVANMLATLPCLGEDVRGHVGGRLLVRHHPSKLDDAIGLGPRAGYFSDETLIDREYELTAVVTDKNDLLQEDLLATKITPGEQCIPPACQANHGARVREGCRGAVGTLRGHSGVWPFAPKDRYRPRDGR